MLLALNHSVFLRARLLPVTTFVLVSLLLPLGLRGPLALFEFAAQFQPSPFTIDRLRPLLLTPYLNPGRPVPQPNGGRGLVHFLTAPPRATNESLVNVGQANAERRETFLNCGIHRAPVCNPLRPEEQWKFASGD